MNFLKDFRAYHILDDLTEKKREELMNLTQGRKTVDEYNREFMQLARYVGEAASMDAKKQYPFHRGLQPDVKFSINFQKPETIPDSTCLSKLKPGR